MTRTLQNGRMTGHTNEALTVERHPLEPFFPERAKVLVCGTFPPQRHRWSMPFFYPNFINDFWRVMGIVYFNDKNALVNAEEKSFRLDLIRELLNREGIAMYDTCQSVIRTRNNASDKYLEVVEPLDLRRALDALPQLAAVVTTGEKAAYVMAGLTSTPVPKVGEYVEFENLSPSAENRILRHWRMPSTSRAYPMPLERKAEFYAGMLKTLRADSGIL